LSARIRKVVTEVVLQAARDRGASHIVLLRAESPEGTLMRRWLEGSDVDVLVPDAADVTGVQSALGGAVAEAERAVARRMAAAAGGCILAHPANKTELLLARELPPEPLLPLGDVWAIEVLDLEGTASLPESLLGSSASEIRDLHDALRSFVEEGVTVADAFRDVASGMRETVMALLRESSWRRPARPVVPKIGHRTLGLDPHL
jgi:hypothetical protein